jgi:signal recognition particle GTPase
MKEHNPMPFSPSIIPPRQESRDCRRCAGITDLRELAEKLTETANKLDTARSAALAQDGLELVIEIYHQFISICSAGRPREAAERAMLQLARRYPGVLAISQALALSDAANEARSFSEQIRLLEEAKST